MGHFSSIRRRTLFYSTTFFMASLCTSVGISYYYLNRENVIEQYLLQQNTLNFCLQELENNIFYSKLSELSNLSIIRNELYRLYRMVDMPLVPPDQTKSETSPYQFNERLLAPTANPYVITRDVEQARNIENAQQKSSLNQLALSLTNFTYTDLDAVIAASNRTRELTPKASSPERLIPNSAVLQNAHDRASSSAPIINGLSELSAQLQTGRTLPAQPNAARTNAGLSAQRPASSGAPDVTRADSPSFHSAADIIARANVRYDQMLAHLSALNFAGGNANTNFITALNQSNDVMAPPGLSPFGPVDPNRLVLYKHLSQLQSLGFIAFSVNTKSSSQDIFIHRGYEQLLDSLMNEQRRLRDLLYHTPIPNNGYFVILESTRGSIARPNPALSPEARALQEYSIQQSRQQLQEHRKQSAAASEAKAPSAPAERAAPAVPSAAPAAPSVAPNAPSAVPAAPSVAPDAPSATPAAPSAARTPNLTAPHTSLHEPKARPALAAAQAPTGTGDFDRRERTQHSLTLTPEPINEDTGILMHAADLDHAIAAAARPQGTWKTEAIEEEEQIKELDQELDQLLVRSEQVQQSILLQQTQIEGSPTYSSALVALKQSATEPDPSAANLSSGSAAPEASASASVAPEAGATTTMVAAAPKSHADSEFEVRYELGKNSNDIATLTDHGTCLGLIASLSFDPDQVLVIITDITKLQQQDEVLKRLIANSLNELVLAVGTTTPVSITLLDPNFNPLAGDLSKSEITRLITPAVLEQTRTHGMFQGYNRHWGHYLTTGYFKPYDWYLLINTDNVRTNSPVWQYLIIIFTVQLVLSIICVFAIGEIVDKDVKDLGLINNKIKNMASLIQDADLVERISEGLPRREDELGTLSNYVRLLGKTLYQSIQEITRTAGRPSAADPKDSARLIYDRMRQNSINREIFLKEYYKDRINVHTEHVAESTGDFFDVIELSSDKLALVVGSSSERGLAAVNLAMLNIALFRQMIRLTESIKLPLGKAVTEINQNIVDNNMQSTLTSVCIVIIEQSTGKVEYLNAGHTLPMLYHKNSGFEYIDIRTGSVLGANGSQQYTSINFELQEGDSLLLYSDGLLDCINHRHEKLGQEGFESMLHDENFDSAADVVNNLCAKLKRYTKDATLDKDYTIACYHYTTQTRKDKTSSSLNLK